MRLLEGARTLLEDRSSTPLLSASQETAPKTTGETPVLPSLSAGEETAPKTTGETPVLPSLSAGEETAPKTTGETPVLPSLSAGQECARLADACARYMDTIVAAQLGRVPYEWRVVGKRKRVSAGSATAREFNADNPVRDAMALRFRAFQSDVFVEQLVVQDASGESLTIRMGRWVRADFAQGGDTVFLDLPLTVSRIYATCRHDSPHPPRLGIEAGVPRVPDYAREIASLCRRAVQAIERQDWTESRDSLSRALRRLSQFHAGQGEQ